jgi:hypothetical protein
LLHSAVSKQKGFYVRTALQSRPKRVLPFSRNNQKTQVDLLQRDSVVIFSVELFPGDAQNVSG